MVLVAFELLGVPAEPVGIAELVAAELGPADLVGVVAEVLGCAGALRGAGVVRRFGVCANDVIESASTNKNSGSTNGSGDNGLKKRFIRGLIV